MYIWRPSTSADLINPRCTESPDVCMPEHIQSADYWISRSIEAPTVLIPWHIEYPSPDVLNHQMFWSLQMFWTTDISNLQIFYSQSYWIPRSVDPLIYWIPIPRCTESPDVLIPQTYWITRCTESRDVFVPRRIESRFSNAKINPCDLQLNIMEKKLNCKRFQVR